MKRFNEARANHPITLKRGSFFTLLLCLLSMSFLLSGCIFRLFPKNKQTETEPPVTTHDLTAPTVMSETTRQTALTKPPETTKASESETSQPDISSKIVLISEEPDDNYDLLEVMSEAGLDVGSFVDKQDEYGVPQSIRSKSMQDMRNMQIHINLDSADARELNNDLKGMTEISRGLRKDAIQAIESGQGFFTWTYVQLLRPYTVNEDTFSFSVYIGDFDYPGEWYRSILSYVFDTEGNLLSPEEILEHVGVTEQDVRDYLANEFAQKAVTGMDGQEHNFVLLEPGEFSSDHGSSPVYIQAEHAYALEGDTLYVVLPHMERGLSSGVFYPIDLQKIR